VKAYREQGHEMLFDAHARAFEAFGGVPQRSIYDNKTAVDQVLAGRSGYKINARFKP
jgi:transposase